MKALYLYHFDDESVNITVSLYLKYNIILKAIYLLYIISVLSQSLIISQWQNDMRLTNDNKETRTTFCNANNIIINNNNVHIVYFTKGPVSYSQDWIVYYMRSANLGSNWIQPYKLSGNTGYRLARDPSIANSADTLYVVYEEGDYNYYYESFEIYFKRSTNDGISWESPVQLTNDTGNSIYPAIAVNNSVIHIVWMADRDGNNEIYYKRSTNAGINWSPDIRLTFDTSTSYMPAISASGNNVYVSWTEYRNENPEIYFKSSFDNGINWIADKRLTNDNHLSYTPVITSMESNINIIWTDWNNNPPEIYYKRSTDYGFSWSDDIRLTNDPGASVAWSIIATGSNLHVAWWDNRDGNPEIYYKLSTDKGLTWGEDIRLTNDAAGSYGPFLAISGTMLHLLWNDNRDGNYEIYYKRNPTGNPIGINPISRNIPDEFKLYQNYPNPFNPVTKIRFGLPAAGDIVLTIYNCLGQISEVLLNKYLVAGEYEIEWNAEKFPSGVYFCILYVNNKNLLNFKNTVNLMLLK